MLDELEPHQFDEWRAFNILEPFGPIAKARLVAAQILTMCSSENDLELSDVLESLGYDVPRRPLTCDDAAAADAAILAAFGF